MLKDRGACALLDPCVQPPVPNVCSIQQHVGRTITAGCWRTAQQAASLADLQKLIAHEAERAHSGRKGAYLTTVLLMPSQVVISPRKSFIADTEEEACT